MLNFNFRETDCARESMKLNNVDEKHDWIKQMNEIHKLAAYKCKANKSYEADGCGYYKSKEICELYSMLWPNLIVRKNKKRKFGNKEILRHSFIGTNISMSGEMLISPQTPLESIVGKRIDWEKFLDYSENEIYGIYFTNLNKRESINMFCRLTGTMGNFIPVPTNKVDYRKEDGTLIKSLCMQTIHKGLNEQFDRVLKVIKAYYYNEDYNDLVGMEKEYYKYLKAIKTQTPDNPITYWLNILFGSWPKFAEKNYLIGSFVNDKMECVLYSQTNLSVLNGILQARGKVMMDAIIERNSMT